MTNTERLQQAHELLEHGQQSYSDAHPYHKTLAWMIEECEAAQRCRDLADHLDQWERMPVETVRKKLRAALDGNEGAPQ